MVINSVTPNPLDPDNSTVCTAITPPETIGDDLNSFCDVDPSSPLIPSDGFTFVIRSISCGRVITLLEGKVVLAHPDGGGSIHWACVETGGWFGFRNCASHNFLGYDENGRLCCSAKQKKNWENFHIGPTREGGYVLLMSHTGDHMKDFWYGRELWHVGAKTEQGGETLAKIGPGGTGGIRWEFIKVQ